MIYITGATSRLGYHVLKELKGLKITPLSRKRLKGFRTTDYSYEDLKRMFKDAKAVIHLAGKVFGSREELERANVLLTQNIVDAIPNRAKLLFSSSISVYGKNPKGVVDETYPINPDTEYAKTKAKAEEIVSSHKNHIIFRIATLYGENFEEYYKVLRMIKRGRIFIIGDGKNKIPLTYAGDVAKSFKKGLKKGKGIYNLSADSVQQVYLYKLVCSMLGIEFKPLYIPKSFALLLAKINNFVNIHPLLKEEIILSLSSNREFSYLKAKKELGFNPIPIEEGLKIMLSKFR